MTQADANVELVARVRDFIYECTSDEFSTGWAPSTHQAEDLIRLVVEPTLHPLPSDGTLLRQLRELAVALHAKHYPEVTQWQPVDDAAGLLDQIDNMTTGLQRSTPTAPVQGDDAELKWLRGFVVLMRCQQPKVADRLERIASRLSGDNNAALVETLKDARRAIAGLDECLLGYVEPQHQAELLHKIDTVLASITSTDADGGRR